MPKKKEITTTLTAPDGTVVDVDKVRDAVFNKLGENLLEPLRQYTYEHCKVEFTAEQLREFSEEMARKFGELSVKEDAKKQVASQFKADIEALLNECNALAAKVRNKSEYQTVKIEIQKFFETKRVMFVRTDTGEIIRERAMTADELQAELPLTRDED
jgi:deoxyribodipyrimidine photolyase